MRTNNNHRRDAETQSSIRQKAKGVLLILPLVLLIALAASAQVPSPKSVLGFNPTDDKTIADWGQITGLFRETG
jgi:hypothetical protein